MTLATTIDTENKIPAFTTHKALLVIADISGFTAYMKHHQTTTGQAAPIVVKLLNALVSASAVPLRLAELEGDAAFFYVLCGEDDHEIAQCLAVIKNQVLGLFRAFYRTLQQIIEQRQCVCPDCRNVRNFRLKMIMHLGEIAIEPIGAFEKLFGPDVILVHRLLKNSIPSREYVLVTEALRSRAGDFHQLHPEKREANCEGIGKVDTFVYYPPAELIGLEEGGGAAATAKPSHTNKAILALEAQS